MIFSKEQKLSIKENIKNTMNNIINLLKDIIVFLSKIGELKWKKRIEI